uniref:Uncharacterized protein n=1 Tax=Myotis myotis TaxID=51298 RepID=A0A7J7SCA2_MYOMY|nr:hypothetical protein mMyoMyo1_009544 [Myotis myotis]
MTTTESSKSIIRFATVPERPSPGNCVCVRRDTEEVGASLSSRCGGTGRPPTPLTCWGVCAYTEGEGAKGKKTVIVRSPRHAANCGRSSAVFGRGCGFAAWGAPPLKQVNPFSACTGPCPILVPPGEGAETPQKSSNAHVFQERRGGSLSLISWIPGLCSPLSQQGTMESSLGRGDGTRGPLIFTGRAHRSSGPKPRASFTFLGPSEGCPSGWAHLWGLLCLIYRALLPRRERRRGPLPPSLQE